jgi:hypothetical protein
MGLSTDYTSSQRSRKCSWKAGISTASFLLSLQPFLSLSLFCVPAT